MNIMIIARDTGNASVYRTAELSRLARSHCKGKGRLECYWIEVREGAGARLQVQYRMPDGWSRNDGIAL